MPVLECRQLSKFYGKVNAVNNLTVEVPPGVTGLLGPNGAGKSSLMRMAMGLVRPSGGSLRVLGEDPWDNPGLLRRVGYVPEGDAPWRDRAALRAAIHAARLTGLTGDAGEERAREALRRVGLDPDEAKPVQAYSHGMRQRLKLALALLHDPELLVLDEPLLGSDPPSRAALIQLVRELAAQGRSVLMSTHVLPDVEMLTRRILLMNHGRLLAHGEVEEIRELLDRYPRTVRIATPRPRELAVALSGRPTVVSVEAQEGAVVVRTPQPKPFFEELQGLLASGDLPFSSVVVTDDNIEAVFRYLVK